MATRLVLGELLSAMTLAVFTGCASQKAEQSAAQPDPSFAQQIVSAQDRIDRDRSMDSHRKPVEMLVFFGTAPGMRIAELGAGGGYSTELFARASGPTGTVYAQDPPQWDGPGLTKAWEARLGRQVMKNTTHYVRQWEEPLPPEAKDLDAVYSVAIYHDVHAEKHDSIKMNEAVFAALKPGGVYYIIDNSAKAGTGEAETERLHRIDEALVREEVQKVGFKFAGEASFLRNATDPRDWNADSGVNKLHTQDRFALKFIKP
jgi:predicted methyltransferase